MLTVYPAPAGSSVSSPADQVSWLDLFDPTETERKSVESTYGLRLPSREELSEIESSSRIGEKDGVLYLNMPIVAYAGALEEPSSPLGFVLSKDVLVTIRYTPLRSFEAAAAKFAHNRPSSSVEAFAAIIDEMVDSMADLLEGVAAELDDVSRKIFLRRREGRRKRTQSNEDLRRVLTKVGSIGDRASRIRDILLGLQRIVPFVSGLERELVPHDVRGRLKAAQNDVLSLTDYELHLSNKVQFLLDAVLGLINTKQNDIFTVLTVVSVVGIPPTLVASIYGMNFKNMPELGWAWGYEFGLGMIVLSAVIPILWFKWKGWL